MEFALIGMAQRALHRNQEFPAQLSETLSSSFFLRLGLLFHGPSQERGRVLRELLPRTPRCRNLGLQKTFSERKTTAKPMAVTLLTFVGLPQTVLDLWILIPCVCINCRCLNGWRHSFETQQTTELRLLHCTALWRHSVNYLLVIWPCVHFFLADKNAAEQKIHGMLKPQILFVRISFWEQRILFSLHIWLHMNFSF